MNENQIEEYLRTVEGMVMDEEKIVTYKLLARTLGINVNTAKQLLYMYLVKQQKTSACIVSATHLLAGLSKDGTFLVSIVNENKLDGAYEKYENITSEHVYSVQKGKASGLEKNCQMLFAADSCLPPPKSYPIKYHKVLEEKTENESRKNIIQNIQAKTDAQSEEKSQGQKEMKQSLRKDEKQMTNKSRSIANFFNNQSQCKNKVKEEKTEEKMEEVNEEMEQVSKNVESELKELPIHKHRKRETNNVKPSSSSKPEEEKKQTKSKEIKNEKKKRKRILSVSDDSESDEEERDALLCAEQSISDTTERLKITDLDDDNNDDEHYFETKRRRKKVVDKTVLLEDGFMETHKEVVYESDSDRESPQQKKKEAKMSLEMERRVESKEEPDSKRVKVSGQKNNPKKQSTLLSFFKKN